MTGRECRCKKPRRKISTSIKLQDFVVSELSGTSRKGRSRLALAPSPVERRISDRQSVARQCKLSPFPQLQNSAATSCSLQARSKRLQGGNRLAGSSGRSGCLDRRSPKQLVTASISCQVQRRSQRRVDHKLRQENRQPSPQTAQQGVRRTVQVPARVHLSSRNMALTAGSVSLPGKFLRATRQPSQKRRLQQEQEQELGVQKVASFQEGDSLHIAAKRRQAAQKLQQSQQKSSTEQAARREKSRRILHRASQLCNDMRSPAALTAHGRVLRQHRQTSTRIQSDLVFIHDHHSSAKEQGSPLPVSPYSARSSGNHLFRYVCHGLASDCHALNSRVCRAPKAQVESDIPL